ncbi:MAG: metal-dependent hydrolase [Thiolinea sp.]
MDPVSQAIVGSRLAQSVSRPRQLAKAAVLGGLSGMAADLDILIRSTSRPAAGPGICRQFTHALLFIPLGGLLCAGVLYALFSRFWTLDFRWTYLWCTVGYSSHGLLDGCTSYGTQLFWPFQ